MDENEGDFTPEVRAAERRLTRILEEDLDVPESAGADFADDPNVPPASVALMLTGLVSLAAHQIAEAPHRAGEAEEAAHSFAKEALRPSWGSDWTAVQEAIIDAAARCRYWPFCFGG